MKTIITRQKQRPFFGRMAGISVVEVMVGLFVSMLLTLGLIQIFSSNKASHELIQSSSKAQEQGRHALRTLRRQAWKAGYRTVPEETPEDHYSGNHLAVWSSHGLSVGDTGAEDTGDVRSKRTVVIPVGTTEVRTINDVKADTDLLVVRYQGAADGSTRDCVSNLLNANIYAVDTFYIGVDDLDSEENRGGSRSSLRCISDRVGQDRSTGSLAPGDPEVIAEGLADLELVFGEDRNGDTRANRYALFSDANLDPTNIVSIKLRLTAQGAKPADESVELSTSAEQHTLEKDVRKEFQSTISLRNMVP